MMSVLKFCVVVSVLLYTGCGGDKSHIRPDNKNLADKAQSKKAEPEKKEEKVAEALPQKTEMDELKQEIASLRDLLKARETAAPATGPAERVVEVQKEGPLVISDSADGVVAGFIPSECFQVAYLNMWPTALTRTDSVRQIAVDTTWSARRKQMFIAEKPTFVALPGVRNNGFIQTDSCAGLNFHGFDPASTGIVVSGLNGQQKIIKREANGTYLVTVMPQGLMTYDGIPAFLTLQFVVGDDGNGARLASTLLPGQKGFAEIMDGTSVRAIGYADRVSPRKPLPMQGDEKNMMVWRRDQYLFI